MMKIDNRGRKWSSIHAASNIEHATELASEACSCTWCVTRVSGQEGKKQGLLIDRASLYLKLAIGIFAAERTMRYIIICAVYSCV